MALPFRLDRVASPADILAALATFNREAPGHSHRGREILRRSEYWVYHPATGRFGPSKFIAYAGMTFAGYDRACTLRDAAPWFKGGIAWPAIEAAAGTAFAPNPALHEPLVRWGEGLLGQGAFGNADRSQWKFVQLVLPDDGDEALVEAAEHIQARGQGFVLDSKLRKALEDFAMDAAKQYFKGQGYQWEDHSKSHPYDLRCIRGAEVLYVEVKGTQTDGFEVILTPGEVEFARGHKNQMALFVLHSVLVTKSDGDDFLLSGGEPFPLLPWDVDGGSLKPLSYKCTLPG